MKNTEQHFNPALLLTKIESSSLSSPLEIDPPRSTFAEYSHETGSTGRSNKGCTVYGRIYPGYPVYIVTSVENECPTNKMFRNVWIDLNFCERGGGENLFFSPVIS